jgi:hypothetical protein
MSKVVAGQIADGAACDTREFSSGAFVIDGFQSLVCPSGVRADVYVWTMRIEPVPEFSAVDIGPTGYDDGDLLSLRGSSTDG